MCINVIEHLLNPDSLMNYLKKYTNEYIIVSTPERKPESKGPPPNIHHIREWERHEFEEYISKFFEIVERETHCFAQYIIGKKR